jgi:hypothetical protein
MPRPPAACIFSALLLACGARTGLDEGQGPSTSDGGAPAGPGGSGAGAAGAGGSGAGPTFACDALFVDGEPRFDVTALGPGIRETEAALVPVDPARLMLFHTQVDEVAEGRSVRAVTFDAWGAWPDDFGEALPITIALRDGFRATPGANADTALLLPLFSLGPPGATTAALAPSVLPATSYSDVPYTFLFDLSNSPGGPASFVRSPTTGRFFVGWRAELEATFLGHVVTDAAGEPIAAWFDSGCAQGDPRAASLPSSDGFIVAISSGRPAGTCLNDDGIPGPAVRLQTGALQGDGGAIEWPYERVESEPIAALELVARPGGAWLVHQTDGSTAFVPPPIFATPLDETGGPVGAPLVVVEENRATGTVAVAPFGSGFALAWVESLLPTSPFIAVRIFDADGTLRAEGSFDTASAFLAPGRISLVTSPNTDALVVAWETFEPEPRVTAARFACVL